MLPVAEKSARSPIDELLDQFCGFLREERGLVPGSIALYERIARRFLVERSEPLADDLARLTAPNTAPYIVTTWNRSSRRRASFPSGATCSRR